MTCIVGLIEDGIAYLAGDSLVVNVPHDFHDGGVSQAVRREPKIFRKQDMLFGFSGAVRMGQLLRYEFRIPEYTSGMGKMEYLVSAFIPDLQMCFYEAEYERKGKRKGELGGNILFVLDGELFTIGNTFHVGSPADLYEAIGKGGIIATGSLHATNQLRLPPLQRLRLALEASEHHTCVVSQPFHYITSEMEQAENL